MALNLIWDAEDDPHGNVQHVAEHWLDKEDVRYVLENPSGATLSRSSGLPCVFGYTESDAGGASRRYIIVVYEETEEGTYPVTAYDVPERG